MKDNSARLDETEAAYLEIPNPTATKIHAYFAEGTPKKGCGCGLGDECQHGPPRLPGPDGKPYALRTVQDWLKAVKGRHGAVVADGPRFPFTDDMDRAQRRRCGTRQVQRRVALTGEVPDFAVLPDGADVPQDPMDRQQVLWHGPFNSLDVHPSRGPGHGRCYQHHPCPLMRSVPPIRNTRADC